MAVESTLNIFYCDGDGVQHTIALNCDNLTYNLTSRDNQGKRFMSINTNDILNLSNKGTFIQIDFVSRDGHRWFRAAAEVHCGSDEDANRLTTALDRATESQDRPKSLLLLVNPGCGRNDGKSLYEKHVAPMFQCANIQAEVIYLEEVKQAYSHLLTCDLRRFDGVVAVGGDGTFHEVVSGILDRTQIDHEIAMDVATPTPRSPKITVGVLPAGSGNAAANEFTGIDDLETATLHVVLGKTSYRDIITGTDTETGSFLGYTAVGMVFQQGIITEVQRMDKLRPLFGPLRYIIAPLVALVLPQKVRKRFRYRYSIVQGTSTEETCGQGCRHCRVGGAGATVDSAAEWFVEDRVAVDVATWNSKAITPWDGVGFFPDNHPGDGAFTVLSKFKDDVDAFQMIKFALGFSAEEDGKDLKNWWKRNTDITNFVTEFKFKYLPEPDGDESNRPDLLLDGEIPHQPKTYPSCLQDGSMTTIKLLTAPDFCIKEVHFITHRHLIKTYGAGINPDLPPWKPKQKDSSGFFLFKSIAAFCFVSLIAYVLKVLWKF